MAAATLAAKPAETVTAAAVWHPPAGFMNRFHAECDGRAGKAFDACFVAAMKEAGAGSAALAFTRRLDGEGYLAALAATGGRLGIAHVFYPFRANENEAWLIVNGTPDLIDVDDLRSLNLQAMRAAPAYRAIARRFPQVDLFPGDRGEKGPRIETGGRWIIVDYRLQDLCHACAVVGHVRFAFAFDAAGRFLGTRLVSVAAAGQETP